MRVGLGDRVAKRQPIGAIADPPGGSSRVIRASIIGHASNLLVDRGDAVVHLAMSSPGDPVDPFALASAGEDAGAGDQDTE